MNRAILILPAILSLAAPALAQTPPAPGSRTASDLTRDLNSGPPAAVPPSQSRPKDTPIKPPAVPATEPSSQAAVKADPEPEVAPLATSPQEDEADGAAGEVSPKPQASDAPASDASAADAAPPPAPEPEPLSAADRATLPFTLDLPAGFQIVRRPAGPRAAVYAVRSEGRSYVMIYAGPASQFPIYDGQRAQVAGRTSVVVTENGRRRAVEHLFQRETEPREIHVWLASVDDDQAALAEQIAQTVDPR